MRKVFFKNYIIYPKFQWKLIQYFLVLGMFTSGVFYGAVWYFFEMFESRGIKVGIPKHHVFYDFINDLHSEMNIIFAVTTIFIFLILIIAGVLISHKVAGPIYRMEADLLEMAQTKKFRPIKFREGDFFMNLATNFNKLLKKKD